MVAIAHSVCSHIEHSPHADPGRDPVPALSLAPSITSSHVATAVPLAAYRRRRVAAVLVAGLLLVAGVRVVASLATTGATGLAAPSERPLPGVELVSSSGAQVVVVQPGDTLWTIAQRLDHRADPRALVDRLVELNGTVALSPGQRLVVPAP